jgi:hypothetical protein
MHTVAGAHFSQVPALHFPSSPQVDCAVVMQRPRGSGAPFVTLAHVPFAPPVSAAEQPWHAPVHARSQQNPSTQKPLTHWSLAVHAVPLGACATQALALQKKPLAHWASPVHVVRQAVAPQT